MVNIILYRHSKVGPYLHKRLFSRQKARPTLITDPAVQAKVSAEMLLYPNCRTKDSEYWSGWSEPYEEGRVADFVTGDNLTESGFQPWYPGEPNGKDMENCVSVKARDNTWVDVPCKKKVCGFCNMNGAPDLKLRGVTVES